MIRQLIPRFTSASIPPPIAIANDESPNPAALKRAPLSSTCANGETLRLRRIRGQNPLRIP
jgi:hypothetical protein